MLSKTYHRLRLCSREHAHQMSGYCAELANKALEVREDSQHLLDMHISLVNFKTSEFMSLLTKFDIVFGPLAFLVGVYGMNFVDMPELQWDYGYRGYFWVLCVSIVALIYLVFIRGS